MLLLPNGSDRVTSAPTQPYESEKKVEDEEVLKLLATSLKKSKSSKKTAKKKARSLGSLLATAAGPDPNHCADRWQTLVESYSKARACYSSLNMVV